MNFLGLLQKPGRKAYGILPKFSFLLRLSIAVQSLVKLAGMRFSIFYL